MKKPLLIVVICMMIAMPALAGDREMFTSGGYEYVLLEDGTAEIVSYDYRRTSEKNPVVPQILDGYYVTCIGDDAFSHPRTGFENLESVTLPYGVTSIGNRASSDCENLRSIALPNSLTSIGNEAFFRCTELTGIYLPDSLTSIGDEAFSGCSNLSRVDLPDNISYMGYNPFRACGHIRFSVSPDHAYLAVIDNALFSKPDKRLISVPSITKTYDVPYGITCIGKMAFGQCEDLTSITLPDSVTSLGDACFFACHSLTSIEIPGLVTEIGKAAFYSCYSLTSIEIPASVTIIGEYTFSDCYSLTSIKIPASVTEIVGGAFSGCRHLTLIVERDSYAEDYCEETKRDYSYADAND